MKKLITQMWNERRTNIGLWLELLVVSVVLWFIVDYVFTTLRTYFEPLGFDSTQTYQIRINSIPSSSPNYTELSEPHGDLEFMRLWMNFMKNHSNIEAVGQAARGIHYSGGSEGGRIKFENIESEELNHLIVTPGYLEVFRMQGLKGESPAEMASRLNKHTFLAGANANFGENKVDLYNYLNKSFVVYRSWSDSLELVLNGILQPFKRQEFWPAKYSSGIVRLLPENEALHLPVFVVRMRSDNRDLENQTKSELETFLRGQNKMITDFSPISQFRMNKLRDDLNDLRNHLVIAGFLMLNVFLGLLGTFWYRTQQRSGEIALHIVVGSTRNQVFCRLCMEGFLILFFATLPALGIDFWLAKKEFAVNGGEFTYTMSRYVITTGITWGLMAFMIFSGIAIPAYRVMKMRPVEALHNE